MNNAAATITLIMSNLGITDIDDKPRLILYIQVILLYLCHFSNDVKPNFFKRISKKKSLRR